ncbi:hypothetical protein [Aquitalea pelogenes]|uniref:hypothetical protein n=1 Tax=Aquitalea pelogenes TaxID=1293573 RepID=UPI0035B3F6E1
MDFSNKKIEDEINNEDELGYDPFETYVVEDQDFESLVIREDIEVPQPYVAPVQSQVAQPIEEEIDTFSDEFSAIENDEGSIPAHVPLDKPTVQNNINQINTKLRFGTPSVEDEEKAKVKANIQKVNSQFRDSTQETQSSVTAEMLAEAQGASAFFQQAQQQQAPVQDRPNPFRNAKDEVKAAVKRGKPTVAQVEPDFEAPTFNDASEPAPGTTNHVEQPKASITPEMMREASVSSSVFQEMHQKEQDKQPKAKEAPEFVVESNVAKWSTIARTDNRINANAMHKHMAEKENAIHDEMQHGKDAVGFFDNRKPEQANNYFEHSVSAHLSHLSTQTGNQYRESLKGHFDEKERNNAAYGNSKDFMEKNQKSEMEFVQKFNPEAVAMVEKKQKFEQVDFNLRDRANNNRLAQSILDNPNSSKLDKKDAKIVPISADEKIEWMNAYKEFDKERKIYQGETITDNKETRIANKLESNFERNYYKMMEKSSEKDIYFDRKEIKPAFEHNKGIKTSVSDIEKERTQNSFRDFKSNQLGETWKHELIDPSIGSATTTRLADPFNEKKESHTVNLSNVKQPARFSDYSPELQAIIMRADEKMQSQYGTKPLDVQFGEDEKGFHSGKAKSMKQIWAETTQKHKAAKEQQLQATQPGKGVSAEMQAIKSLQPKSELSDDKKQILSSMNGIRDKIFPDIVDDKKKKQINQETGIGL